LSKNTSGLKTIWLHISLLKSWDSSSHYELYICSGVIFSFQIITMHLHGFQCLKFNYAVPGHIQKSVSALKNV